MGHFLSDGVQLKVPRTWNGALSTLGVELGTPCSELSALNGASDLGRRMPYCERRPGRPASESVGLVFPAESPPRASTPATKNRLAAVARTRQERPHSPSAHRKHSPASEYTRQFSISARLIVSEDVHVAVVTSACKNASCSAEPAYRSSRRLEVLLRGPSGPDWSVSR